jgi:putative ABC transport system permease protein
MLVSVTERTREIGLRVAVGARARDIFSQFLVEALALGGGPIGVSLGFGVAHTLAYVAGWQILIQPQAILLTVGFAVAVGMVFGVYPARRAARPDPVEALRFE